MSKELEIIYEFRLFFEILSFFLTQGKVYTWHSLRKWLTWGQNKIPMKRNFDLQNDNSKFLKDSIPFRKLIGKLMSLNITRLYQNQPRKSHENDLFKILRYQKKISEQEIAV